MLHEFLDTNRQELIARCRAKVELRSAPRATPSELEHGIPLFLQQLTHMLHHEQSLALLARPGRTAATPPPVPPPAPPSSEEIDEGAAIHGYQLLRQGFTVDQVVHDYGDLCQAVTELAMEKSAVIDADEFRILNLCLDNAIAGAVAEYGRQHDQVVFEASAAAANERLGVLAHELRNQLSTAILAVDAVKRGHVGLGGATGAMLDRSLIGLRNLIDRALAEVRVAAGLTPIQERISISDFIEEAQVAAVLEAQSKGLSLVVTPVQPDLWVWADRHILSSALTNLLQNAFKFTRPQGQVSLLVYASAAHISIAVQDQCGGLPSGLADELFRPFHQRGGDRSGIGLGLSISRKGVEESGGRLYLRDLPGTGCVFTIELPRVGEQP